MTVGQGNQMIAVNVGEIAVDAAFIEALLIKVLEKFTPDTPVTMTFRKAHFASGHDLKDFAGKLGIELAARGCRAMSEKPKTVDFGAPDTFGAHLFRVEIPAARTEPVVIVEDYGYRGQEGGIPRDEERVVLKRPVWSAIADIARREFNDRLKAAKVLTGRWHTGTNLVDRLLGKELCVLAWAAETANARADSRHLQQVGGAAPGGALVALRHDRGRSGLARGHPARLAARAVSCPLRRRKARRRTQTPPPGGAGPLSPAAVRGFRMSDTVTPFSLKDAPALIERLLPVQKLSAEAYKEQMAGSGKTLTALGSYWKGRKPLILNKACILGCLLPATDDPARDLEIFEKLMAMDDESFVVRWKRRPKPKEILATLSIACIADYFTVEPEGVLPASAPVDWSKPEYDKVKVAWREDITELERRRLEAQMLPKAPYRERVDQAKRPEEVMDTVHDHIWDAVNAHLGTSAQSFPELVEQLGIMRFGHRPRWPTPSAVPARFPSRRLGSAAMSMPPTSTQWPACSPGVPSTSSAARREPREAGARAAGTGAHGCRRRSTDSASRPTARAGGPRYFSTALKLAARRRGWMVPLLPTLIVSKG